MTDSTYGREFGRARPVNSPASGYNDDDPGAIRADIGETRRRMSQALDEIGDRINPENIKEQVKHNVRDATIGRAETMARHTADRARDVRYSIMDTIRDNPLPAAVTGFGLGWLMWNGRRDDHMHDRNPYATGYGWDDGYPARGGRFYAQGGSAHLHDESTGMENVKDMAGEATDRTRDAMYEARERTAEAADHMRDRARELADDTRSAARRVAERTRDRSHRLEDRFEHTMRDAPLAIGAAAAAIGLAIGLSAPATRRESELMGETRDRLRDRAKHATRDAAERVSHVAEETVHQAKSTAKETAREEGLTH